VAVRPIRFRSTKTIEAITGAGEDGQIGDGKIFVLDLESVPCASASAKRRCGDLNPHNRNVPYGQS